MDSIRVAAKTVEDALTEASIQLETSSDNIEYTVIDEGSKGLLFGLGGRDAVIEAKKKVTDEDLMKEIFDDTPKKEEKKKPVKDQRRDNNSKKEREKDKKEPKDKEGKSKEETGPDITEKKESKEQKEKKEQKEPKEQRAPKTPADPEEAKKRALDFVKSVLEAMQMPSEVTAEFEDDTLCVNIEGEDMGILIGKRGQTLDSLQYLTSLVVNKGKSSYVRVKLDTEDYRNRRKATLENLAKNVAVKVKKTKKPVFLEPMNPYERRIIHSALQNDPYVTTHSEGDEPYRKVVVTLKKDREKGHSKNNDHHGEGYENNRSNIESEQDAYAEAAQDRENTEE